MDMNASIQYALLRGAAEGFFRPLSETLKHILDEPENSKAHVLKLINLFKQKLGDIQTSVEAADPEYIGIIAKVIEPQLRDLHERTKSMLDDEAAPERN
jgi:hypothetical protein